MSTNSTAVVLYQPARQAGQSGLLQGIAGAWRAYMQRRAQRATLRVLAAMDDRMLKDIGITRSEIQSVVYSEVNDRAGRFGRTLA